MVSPVDTPSDSASACAAKALCEHRERLLDYINAHGLTHALAKLTRGTPDEQWAELERIAVGKVGCGAREKFFDSTVDTAPPRPYPLNMTNATETLTDDMLSDLRDEAAQAGDTPMLELCDLALHGTEIKSSPFTTFAEARELCAAAITAGRAQDDSRPFVRVTAD